MDSRPPKESELLRPVISLFERPGYLTFLEAKLSRKRIDVLFVPPQRERWISVELKVHDWKTALWQAALNLQVAEYSYVALWHTFIRRALRQEKLFNSYGIGLISVSANDASILIEGKVFANQTRARQQELILEESKVASSKDGRLDALPFLPAQRPAALHQAY